MPSRCEICCEIIIAILLPPLGVCFRHGCCSVRLSIFLLLLFRDLKIWIYLMDNFNGFLSILFFSGGILDLLVTHYFRLRSWNNLCSLCNCVYRPGWVFWWRQASSLCPGVSVNYHTSPFGFIELHFIYEICVLCLNNVKINGITA